MNTEIINRTEHKYFIIIRECVIQASIQFIQILYKNNGHVHYLLKYNTVETLFPETRGAEGVSDSQILFYG